MFVILPTLIAIVNFIFALLILNSNMTSSVMLTTAGFVFLFISYVNMRD